MLVSVLAKLKNKSFWAGIATAIAGVLTGALSAPEGTTRKRKNQPARAKTSYKRKTTVKKKKRSAQPKKDFLDKCLDFFC